MPFSFVVAGAALALVISFVVLFFAWRRPRYPGPGGRPLYGLTRLVDWPPFRWLAQLVILGVYGWAALALFAGKDLLTNPIFGFVFAWMWVGLVPLSLLLGPFWAVTNRYAPCIGGCALWPVRIPGSGCSTFPTGSVSGRRR